MRIPMKIKFCGLRREEDITYVNELKPDFAGFILSDGFKRTISLEQMKNLKAKLSSEIPAVGVFVNDDREKIISLLEDGIINYAQLHGQESEEDIIYMKEKSKRPVIKVIKVEKKEDIAAWLNSSADFLLLDSGTGTGKTFDWSLISEIGRDYFLAGGLNPENIEVAKNKFSAYCLDVSSGAETDGVKDFEKMKRIIELIRK